MAQRSTSPTSVRYMDFARATITRDISIPGPMQCGLSRSLTNRQNTQHFTSLKRVLALPSTGSWLPSRLSSTWRWKELIECIFSTRNRPKKAEHFKWKAGKRDSAKKREFTPESGTVDTYAVLWMYTINIARIRRRASKDVANRVAKTCSIKCN